MNNMVIYKSTPAVIRNKSWHIKKIGGRPRKAFCNDLGDIPVANYNEQTKKFEEVVNLRGNAYALRNDMKFYKKVN